jgi:hypothetical protein
MMLHLFVLLMLLQRYVGTDGSNKVLGGLMLHSTRRSVQELTTGSSGDSSTQGQVS